MATSLGHRGEQGAAIWFHPEDAEREEPLPAGHQPRRPAEALAPPELEQAEVSGQHRCSEGGDRGRGAGNKAVECGTSVCLGRLHVGAEGKSFCLRKQGGMIFFFLKKEGKIGVRGIKDTPVGPDPWLPGSGQIVWQVLQILEDLPLVFASQPSLKTFSFGGHWKSGCKCQPD